MSMNDTMSEADGVRVELVLTRGPTTLPRRLELRLPCDGTTVTLGRAPHCTVILDPLLVFASQVQCSLFALPAAVSSNNDDEEDNETVMTAAQLKDVTATEVTHDREGSASKDSTHPSASPQRVPAMQVYITDMCSSNGTFVNNKRIGSVEPTPLHDGDRCIFGGMRDIEIGAELPADAFAGPELIVWHVIIFSSRQAEKAEEIEEKRRSIAFEATPMVLPKEDVWRAEACALLASAQRSLHGETGTHMGSLSWAEGLASVSTTRECPATHRDSHTLPTPQQLFPPQDGPACCDDATPQPQRELNDALHGDKEEEGEHYNDSSAHEVSVGAYLQTPIATNTINANADLVPTPTTTCRATVALSLHALPVTTPSHAQTDKPMTPQPQQQQQTPVQANNNVFRETTAAPLPLRVAPAPVFFRVMRLGRHHFSVPAEQLWAAPRHEEKKNTVHDEASEETQETEGTTLQGGRKPTSRSRKRTRARTTADAEAEHTVHNEATTRTPYALSFTSTHWRWAMDDPNESAETVTTSTTPKQSEIDGVMKSSSSSRVMPFHCLLPITSVSTVLACTERLGLAVELKEGCQLPLVQPHVTSGKPEYRWLVWLLEATQPLRSTTTTTTTTKSTPLQPHRRHNEQHTESKDKTVVTMQTGQEGDVTVGEKDTERYIAKEDDAEGTSDEASMWFTQWLAQLEAFYTPYDFPPPHLIDANTFDQLFGPHSIACDSSNQLEE